MMTWWLDDSCHASHDRDLRISETTRFIDFNLFISCTQRHTQVMCKSSRYLHAATNVFRTWEYVVGEVRLIFPIRCHDIKKKKQTIQAVAHTPKSLVLYFVLHKSLLCSRQTDTNPVAVSTHRTLYCNIADNIVIHSISEWKKTYSRCLWILTASSSECQLQFNWYTRFGNVFT